MVGYDGGRDRRRRARRPRHRHAARSTSPASRRRRRARITCCGSAGGVSRERRVAGARRVRARVDGTVQGVGFRPYVLSPGARARARRLGAQRRARRAARGRGRAPTAVERFLARLPPRRRRWRVIERVEPAEVAPARRARLRDRESAPAGEATRAGRADVATCADCLAELFDPADRRYRYPFVNCTNCGPRFTIVRGVPYDRPLTTMAGFAMCAACRAEYEDPADRRFHAQPNACPGCGPRLRCSTARAGRWPATRSRAAAAALAGGRDRRRQGAGRVPPRLPRRRRGRRGARCGRASTARTSRSR